MINAILDEHSEPQMNAKLAHDTSDEALMAAVGTDLSKYPSVTERELYEPLAIKTNREMVRSLLRGYRNHAFGQVPNPAMLTHIVTTRCNYSCGFCSFADTLNVKMDELSLQAIEKTYATIGDSLNTIVYSGGETTLNRNLPEIIEAAYRLTPVKSVYIISNAWKPELLFEITHRIKQRCPNLHLTWSLSIEGPKAINNAARHTRNEQWDAWQNTVDTMWGLKKIREQFDYRELDVQLCTVCGPNNAFIMQDWYEMVRDVLQPDKWNLNLLRKSVMMSDHEMESWETRRRSGRLEHFEEVYIAITEQLRKDALAGHLKFQYHTKSPLEGSMKSALDLISQADNRQVITGQNPGICCKAGNNGAYIGSDGKVSGCEEFANSPHENKSFGNLNDVDYDFQAVWHSEAAKAYRTQAGKAKECYGCTLESQKNYPSVLFSIKHLSNAYRLSRQIQDQADNLASPR
jgi:MoaA/NifB/PqqE/SkfB family radical SAM enzyme